jgi:hypothetical protein
MLLKHDPEPPMKTVFALSLLFFTSSASAAVIGKDVQYTAGEPLKAVVSYHGVLATESP